VTADDVFVFRQPTKFFWIATASGGSPFNANHDSATLEMPTLTSFFLH